MLKGKTKVMLLGLVLAIAIPLVAFAAENPAESGEVAKKFVMRGFFGGTFMQLNEEELKAKVEEIQQKIETGELPADCRLQEKLSEILDENGEISEEWKAKMEELKEKVANGELQPRMKGKHGKMLFRGVPEELKASMDDLHAKLEAGELTIEQFREQLHALMGEHRPHKMEQRTQFKRFNGENTDPTEATNTTFLQKL